MAVDPQASNPQASNPKVDVVVNGETTSLAAGLTLASWLESIGRDPRTVAIEYNGRIVPRGDYGDIAIEAGDRLEVVHFVQGG